MYLFYKSFIYFLSLFAFNFIFAQSPGGVSNNLALWLKAEDYNPATPFWTDSSPLSLNFIADAGALAAPGKVDNYMNFNPAATFFGATSSEIVALQSERNPGFSTLASARNAIVVANFSNIGTFRSAFSYGLGAGTDIAKAFYIGGQNDRASMSIKRSTGSATGDIFIPGVYTSNSKLEIVNAGVNASGNLLLQHNAGSISTVAPSVALATTDSRARVGSGQGTGSINRIPWRGHIAEVIFYNTDHTSNAANINRVYSYLALKYGISLNDGVGFNYLNSDGTVVWNATTSSGYNNDVFGIGRDTNAGFNQQISKSNQDNFLIFSTDTNFTNANGTHTNISTDKSYFIAGHNNLDFNFIPYPQGTLANQISTKKWKYFSSGNIGTVNIQVNDSSVTHLLVSSDPTFASGVTEVPMVGQVASYNFGSGVAYFAFAKVKYAPGGVFNSSSAQNGVAFKVYDVYDSTPENGFDRTNLLQTGLASDFLNIDRQLTSETRQNYTISAKSTLTLSSTQNYYFRFSGMRAATSMAIFIDGVFVFNGNGTTSNPTHTMASPISLTAGSHEVEVVFSKGATDASNMEIRWSSDGTTFTPIPDNLLSISAGSAELLNWHRADLGISDADGATLTSWQDQSGFDSHLVSISGTPKVYKTTSAQLLNFNPSVLFEYDKAATSGYSKNVLVNQNPRTSFVVSTKTNPTFQNIAGIGGGNKIGTNQYYALGSDYYKQNIKHSNQNTTSSTNNYQLNNIYISGVRILNPNITATNNLHGFINNTQTINSSVSSVATYLSDAGYFSIGDAPIENSTGFNGNISEVFHYPFALNDSEMNRVNSYLALKYGVSLSEGTGANYTASNGSTIFWNSGTNAGFNFGVFGIGRDDISILEQQISTSSRNKSILTISTDNNFVLPNKSHTAIPNNLSFFMVGNNGLDIDYDDYASSPLVNKIMKRKWKVQETGTNIPNINLNINDPNVTHLLVSNVSNFSSLVATVPLVGKSISYDFNSGQYFTFGFDASGAVVPTVCPDPGNPVCETNVVIWTKNEPFDASKIIDQMFLQIDSYTKGLAITQVVDPAVDIEFPYPGMLVFDTTEDCLKIYRNASWSGCILLDQN